VLQQHTFAFAAAPDDGRQFSCGNGQVHAAQHGLFPQRFFDTDELNHVNPAKIRSAFRNQFAF
jgi:hypothetical protein